MEMGNVPSSASAGTTLLAVGDPVLDIVSDCPAWFVVESLGFALGGCDLIDEDELEDVVGRLKSANRTLRRIPGGSAANVAKCFARLSSGAKRTNVYFAGTLGRDSSGKRYRREMEAAGVKMRWSTVHPTEANGVCLCMVTESGERTMRTALRASRTHELSQKCIDALRPTWVHFEGYYVYKPSIRETMRSLKGRGSKISFDFASFDVIASRMEVFEEILDARLVDVLFCNEEEAVAFAMRRKMAVGATNAPETFAREMAAAYGVTMVVSRGPKGCVAAATGVDGTVQLASAPAACVKVVDTIGAGDHFSAGFLYALAHGATLETACQCGCIAGAAAVEVSGAQVDDQRMKDVVERLHSLIAE